MVDRDAPAELARRARQVFAEQLAGATPRILENVVEAARDLLSKPAERAVGQQRRDNLQALTTHGGDWSKRLAEAIQDAVDPQDSPDTISGQLLASMQGTVQLELVDDETVQRNIFAARLGQGISDVAMWEFNDVSARIGALGGDDPEREHQDVLRPQRLARLCVQTFLAAGMGAEVWGGLEATLRREIANAANEAYHETNRWLIDHRVMPEVNLRQLIRRSLDTRMGSLETSSGQGDWRGGAGGGAAGPGGGAAGPGASGPGGYAGGGGFSGGPGGQGAAYGGSGGAGGGPGGHAGGGAASGFAGAPGAGAPGQGGQPGYGSSGEGRGRPGGASGYGGGSPSGYGGAAGGSGGASGYGGGGYPPGAGGRAGAWPPGERGGGAPAGGADVPSRFTRATDFVQDPGPASGRIVGPGQVAGFADRGPPTMQQFRETLERQVPGFLSAPRSQPSAALSGALVHAQQGVVHQIEARRAEGGAVAPAEMMETLRLQRQMLKKAAETPAERATIEIVALLFQSILTEERIPSSVRVWFARLQMPVLRVAVSEPDFFSSAEHPARRLIDRMGACVMGFDAAQEGSGPQLEAEVARVVQVVEAFPETGRKVFQSVLVEFERFLERYFRDHNETTRRGVSLANQVEQRETLAIQYTIELRKLLDGVPVQDGVREFLFQVWADVLATTAMRHGQQSPEARGIRDASAELVWIASAKTTREERAEVIRRLGPLLAALRRGMQTGGLSHERQETALRALNIALTAAFAARVAPIDQEQFAELKHRLETLDEILPDADFEIDDSIALDLSGHESDELEVVAEGGTSPSAGALAAAEAMQVGAWYMLEYRERREQVQLAWQGMRRQLSLFVSARGRCVLFQKRRLAAFMQAQLLMPAQDEPLTIVATRNAMEKINADPERLR